LTMSHFLQLFGIFFEKNTKKTQCKIFPPIFFGV
jgi:hypothetical protein